MFTLGHIITGVAFFIFVQSKVHVGTLEMQAEDVEPTESVSRGKRSVNPEDAILAGELTPVFLARKYGLQIYYQPLRSGIVKEAFDYLDSENFRGLARVQRSVNDASYSIEEPQLNPHLNRSKRDANEEVEYYYPSLLVTMEHSTRWPDDERDEDKIIFEKILYALAYWNEVEIQLRAIRHPGIRLRISAIIIGYNNVVTGNGGKYFGRFGLHLYNSLQPTLLFWQYFRGRNPDFGVGSFNVVASMLDLIPAIGTRHGHSLGSPACSPYVLDEVQSLTNLTGLMVYDQENFGSIGQTVAEMSHIMGRSSNGLGASVDGTSFTKQDLLEIKNGLKTARCWEKPLEMFPPGKPVPRLFRVDFHQR